MSLREFRGKDGAGRRRGVRKDDDVSWRKQLWFASLIED